MSFHNSPASDKSSDNTAPAVQPNRTAASGAYEAPAIETVLSSDDLQREVLYAGTPGSLGGAPTPP